MKCSITLLFNTEKIFDIDDIEIFIKSEQRTLSIILEDMIFSYKKVAEGILYSVLAVNIYSNSAECSLNKEGYLDMFEDTIFKKEAFYIEDIVISANQNPKTKFKIDESSPFLIKSDKNTYMIYQKNSIERQTV